MKRLLVSLLWVILLMTGCRKIETTSDPAEMRILRENLTKEDFSNIDRTTLQTFTVHGQKVIRVAFRDTDPFNRFVVIITDRSGIFKEGKIININGKTHASSKNKNSMVFSGSIRTSSLSHDNETSSAVHEGFIMSLHQSNVQLMGIRVNKVECSDCTLPEVMVSTNYYNNSASYVSWLSLWWMFDQWSTSDYIPVDFSGGGGGGDGGYTPPAVISIDEEVAENKEKIDPKKYMDCFGNVPDAGSTCTITISSDIPVDGNPEILFDWSQGNPGHVFIELYKLGQNGSMVSQNIGFYPSIGYKVLDGNDAGSKLVDNAGHEYNARYTVSISPGQLQAAIDKVKELSGNSYNMTNFNCVDFALGVFNAGIGGGFSLNKQQIPGYPTPGGSNTPQALYNKIQDLGSWGTPGTERSSGKAFGGSSKGPCN